MQPDRVEREKMRTKLRFKVDGLREIVYQNGYDLPDSAIAPLIRKSYDFFDSEEIVSIEAYPPFYSGTPYLYITVNYIDGERVKEIESFISSFYIEED